MRQVRRHSIFNKNSSLLNNIVNLESCTMIPSTFRKSLDVKTWQPAVKESASYSKVLVHSSVSEHHNILRKDLGSKQKVTRSLRSCGRLWVNEFTRVKIGLSNALVMIECFQKQNDDPSFYSTGASKTPQEGPKIQKSFRDLDANTSIGINFDDISLKNTLMLISLEYLLGFPMTRSGLLIYF